jgi:tRNA threonylcarbamoyladenosine biosynthesis protein TsaB
VLILAIESATDAAGVALANEAGTVAQSTVSVGRRHAETIAPAIKWCCDSAGASLRDVSAIAVDIGPGLFTGLRVGVGTAKALAYALDRPVVAVSSLQVLLRSASSGGSWSDLTTIVAVLDARRGEVVSAEVQRGGGGPGSTGSPLEERLEVPEDLAERLGGQLALGAGPLFVGDGAFRHREILEKVPRATFGDRWLASPPVSVLAEIGVEMADRGEFADAATLLPRYVRQADARINWTMRATRPDSGTI